MQFDAEAALQFIAQVHPPPAHHPVPSRIGTGLDQFDQFGLLIRRQFRLRTWRLEIMQATQALGVVAVHPIPQGLAIHAASLGSQFAIRTVEDHRDRQYSPDRRTVLLAAGRRPQLRRRQVEPSDRNRRSHRCRSFSRATIESDFL